MGSAKTALLLTTAYNFEERKMSYMCMKPVIDTRDHENVIASRIGIRRECQWIFHDTDLYAMAKTRYKEKSEFIQWYLIDEAQFLTEAQVDQLARIVDDFGSNVICYGLRTDFQSHLFEGSRRLFEIADTIDEIKSTCNCGRKTIMAILSRRESRWRLAATTAMWPCAANVGATSASSRPRVWLCRFLRKAWPRMPMCTGAYNKPVRRPLYKT